MDPVAKNFVRMSVIYFAIAAIIGAYFMFCSAYYRQLFHAHVHVMLLGWISMMIYGVGYHILPRFNGNPVAFPKLAVAHLFVANIALVGFAVTWGLTKLITKMPAQGFAVLNAIGVILFVVNMLFSIRKAKED